METDANVDTGAAKPRIDVSNVDWDAIRKEVGNDREPGEFDPNLDYDVRYHLNTKAYWMRSKGRWIEAGPQEVRRHLQINHGLSTAPNGKGMQSDLDCALQAAVANYSMDKVGSYV